MDAHFVRDVPLDLIVCKRQVRQRFNDESLVDLTQSMREVGLMQPIRAQPLGSQYLVLDGERRVRAARAAGWVTIACIVDEQAFTEGEIAQRQLIANCQREDLTSIEKARAMDGLMKGAKWTEAQIAARLGMSASSVSKLLTLLLLPEELQEQIDAGALAPSTAYEIAKTRDPDERAKLANEAARGALTRDEAARRSRASGKPRPTRQPRRTREAAVDRVRLMLGGRRSVVVSGPAMNLASLIAWAEELLGRLRALAAPDMTLDAAVKALNAERKDV